MAEAKTLVSYGSTYHVSLFLVLTSPRAQTIITSPCQSAKRAADDHDNASDNEFSLVAIPGTKRVLNIGTL